MTDDFKNLSGDEKRELHKTKKWSEIDDKWLCNRSNAKNPFKIDSLWKMIRDAPENWNLGIYKNPDTGAFTEYNPLIYNEVMGNILTMDGDKYFVPHFKTKELIKNYKKANTKAEFFAKLAQYEKLKESFKFEWIGRKGNCRIEYVVTM